MSGTPAPAAPQSRRSQSIALAQNLVAVLTWSLAPTMVKAITASFSVNF